MYGYSGFMHTDECKRFFLSASNLRSEFVFKHQLSSFGLNFFPAVPPWLAMILTAFESINFINRGRKYGAIAIQVFVI